jgi:nucleoside phosphorylase
VTETNNRISDRALHIRLDMEKPSRPENREGFSIAVICALVSEANAVEACFDEIWDDDFDYGKAPGDTNAYTLGRIGVHNAVLAFMPDMGASSAARVASSFQSSFPCIRLALVVGICGAVPFTKDGGEILLGDVVVSTGVVQYDFGRKLPDKFVRKDTLNDNLGRPNTEIRSLLSKLGSFRVSKRLKANLLENLTALTAMEDFNLMGYPGTAEDKLHEVTYRHKHYNKPSCSICNDGTEDSACPDTTNRPCKDLGCSASKLVPRRSLNQEPRRPALHFGNIASGNLVMQSGRERDEIAARENIVAFEMEGAGVWDTFPCIIIKAVCDYADSHKHWSWQPYATVVAASCMKAFLKEWPAEIKKSDEAKPGKWMAHSSSMLTRIVQSPPSQPSPGAGAGGLSQGGSTFSGTNHGRDINQIGNIGGDYIVGR